MKYVRTLLLCLFAAFPLSGAAQETSDRPLPPPVPFERDSGPVSNSGPEARTVHSEVVRIAGAGWLRIYFGDVLLGDGSFLRITSELDGEVQELDADALAMWKNTSGYFNGDTVRIELVGAPQSDNQMIVSMVAYQDAAPATLCGADDRVPSDEDWSGRIEPNGCSGNMWREDGCMVSAGHCFDGPNDAQVIEFRVPLSLPDCAHQHPPIADQFPIVDDLWAASGVGNDWAVARVGTNNLGQTHFERYGELRPLALSLPATGQPITIWGYGSDSECILDNVQQISIGSITDQDSNDVSHNADTMGGSSGSSIMHEGAAIAVHTHGGCPAGSNRGTRIDLANFASARAQLCLSEAGDITFGRPAYNCVAVLEMLLEDSSLAGVGQQDITLTSDTESLGETLTLNEAYAATFSGSMTALETPPVNGDGVLSIAHGDTITAIYEDADAGGGSPDTRTEQVVADCVAPVISDVQVGSITETSALITWTTDEPSTSRVFLEAPSGNSVTVDTALVTEHAVLLETLNACEQYLFSVSSLDLAGNEGVDDNSGDLYPFSAVCPAPGPVPDGTEGGTPITVSKALLNSLVVHWDNSCDAPGPAKLLYGPLDGVSEYELSGSLCDLSADNDFIPWGVPAESVWFVVVRENGFFVEGSWGEGTDGERNGEVPSGECGVVEKDSEGTCLP